MALVSITILHGVLPITLCPIFELSLFPQYYHNPGLNSALILPNIGGWVFIQSRNPWSSGGERESLAGCDHIATSNSAFAGVHLSCWLTILLKRFRLFFRGKKKLGTLHQCPCILLLFKLSEYTEGWVAGSTDISTVFGGPIRGRWKFILACYQVYSYENLLPVEWVSLA